MTIEEIFEVTKALREEEFELRLKAMRSKKSKYRMGLLEKEVNSVSHAVKLYNELCVDEGDKIFTWDRMLNSYVSINDLAKSLNENLNIPIDFSKKALKKLVIFDPASAYFLTKKAYEEGRML